MRHGDEQAQALEFIYTTVKADPVLAELAGVQPDALEHRVWPDVAPPDAATPYLVYSAGEAVDRAALGAAPRPGAVVPVNVRWITLGADASAGAPAGRRLYALLHGRTNVSVSDGGLILTCRRTGSLSYGEDAGGIEYRHTGALLSVEVN